MFFHSNFGTILWVVKITNEEIAVNGFIKAFFGTFGSLFSKKGILAVSVFENNPILSLRLFFWKVSLILFKNTFLEEYEMKLVTQNLIDLVGLSGEIAGSTIAEIVKSSETSPNAARQLVHRLVKGTKLLIKHPSNPEHGVDATYTFTKRGREATGYDSPHYIYENAYGTRQHKILSADLLSIFYTSSLPEIALEDGLYNGAVGWSRLQGVRKKEKGDSKDTFRNNQAIGIAFLPKQILVLYCIRPQMRFSDSAESSIPLEIKRLIEFGELKGRYTFNDLYAVFYFLDTATYLDWLMPTRTGGAKSIKQYIKSQYPRGHAVVVRKDTPQTKLLLRDIIECENLLPKLNGKMTNWIDRTQFVSGILSEGMSKDAVIVINSFADPVVINRLYSDIVKYRKKNGHMVEEPIYMMTLDFNKTLIRAVGERRYPTNKPYFKVMGIDYGEWRESIVNT